MRILNLGRCAGLLLLLLGGCSEPTKTEKTKVPEKAPEPLTGRQAFQRIFPQARAWAPDAQPVEVRSIRLSQVKPEKGKSGAWEAMFVSASKGKSRTYTYSAVEAEGNLHEGVFAGPEESYSGPRGPAFPFLIAALKVDSDQAYDVAAEKSRDYIQKHPDLPISYLLEQTNRFPSLTWRVIWGESVSASDYSVFVDATLGRFLAKAH
jgi:hypothetical protein